MLEADAQDLPFPDDSFDTVVCTYTLCSVPDDVLAVGEMRRVLRPGGRLILVDHVRSTVPPIHWVQWVYEFVPRRTKGEYMTRRPAQHVMREDFQIVRVIVSGQASSRGWLPSSAHNCRCRDSLPPAGLI